MNNCAATIRPALDLPDRQPTATVALNFVGQNVQDSNFSHGKASRDDRRHQAAQDEALAVLYPWPALAPGFSALAAGRNSIISLVASNEAKLLYSRKCGHWFPLVDSGGTGKALPFSDNIPS
jgi:hypothetical protein